jgi:hypothetical protein
MRPLYTCGAANIPKRGKECLCCGMTTTAFGILCFLSFVVPVPLLAWLDKPKGGR